MDYFDSIRIRALASVMDPTFEDFIDDVFEWYSVTYHTPLHVVEHELPLDDVMRVYFRHIYKAMPPEDRHNLAIWLLETPEERAARASEDQTSEEKFMAQAAAVNAKIKKPTKADELFKKMREKAASDAQLDLGDGVGRKIPLQRGERIARVKEMPEVNLPVVNDPEPDEITIKYASTADFEADLDKPLKLPPKRKKK